MYLKTCLTFFLLTSLSLSVACTSTPKPKKDDLVNQANTTKAKTADQLIKQGNTALVSRQYKDAIKLYNQSIKQSPNRWQTHHNLAIAYSNIPDFHRAIESIRKAMTLGAEKDARAWFTLGNLYQNRGMHEESIQAYRASLSLQAKPDMDTLLNISAGYLFLFRYDEAKKTLDYILELAPRDPRVHHNLALINHLQRKYKEAEEGYAHVHTIAPDYDYSYFTHADVLRKQSKCKEAIPMYQKYLSLSPKGAYIIKAKQRLKKCKEKVAGK